MSKATKRERQKENRERAREERERLMKRDRRMKTARGLLILLAPLALIAIYISATSGGGAAKASDACGGPAIKSPKRTFTGAPPMTIDTKATYTATVCTSEGDITLTLDPKAAPIATNNFVTLAKNGFYDGLSFHRASKNFVIQGGDPKGNGSGGPGYSVAGEVPTDHYPLGALAAAKTGTDPAGSFGSQFFIVTGSKGATLPNDYARFGTVTSGLKIAQAIEKLAPATGDGAPTKKVAIVKVLIKQNGVTLAAGSAAGSTTTRAPATSPATAAPPTSTTKKP